MIQELKTKNLVLLTHKVKKRLINIKKSGTLLTGKEFHYENITLEIDKTIISNLNQILNEFNNFFFTLGQQTPTLELGLNPPSHRCQETSSFKIPPLNHLDTISRKQLENILKSFPAKIHLELMALLIK